jgi:hypothetical protein
MRYLISFLAALCLAATPLCANLVANGDFETGDFSDWFHSAGCTVVSDNGPSAAGVYAVEIVVGNDMRTPAIAVVEGFSYDVSFDWKATSMDGAYWGGFRYWSGVDASRNPTGWLGQTLFQYGPTPDGQWQQASFTASPIPAGAAYADVVFFNADATGGVFSVDNVSVVPEPATMAILALGGLFIRRK